MIPKTAGTLKPLINHYSSVSSTWNRRVVVTGMGVLCPVGRSVSEAWTNIINGSCGITQLSEEDYASLPCKVAAKIPDLNLGKHFSKSELRSMAPATAFALIAAKEALQDAQWMPTSEEEKQKTGVAVGMGMIDLIDVCETAEAFKKSYNKVSPFFVPRILPNMAAGQISIKYGFRGPNHAISTACATGAHSIGDAFRFIQHGDADVMVCGGAEACISPLAIAAFCRLRALSTSFNDNPSAASRPFDKDRDGFVMGEGSAILVLEELEHAQTRNATIHAEILGYGLSGDASHLTAPSEDGTGAVLAMTRAMNNANVQTDKVTYINAHATSTPVGDAIESKAIKTVFGKNTAGLATSSTKGAHGHLLGSAGNLETVFTIMACKSGWLPPTINFRITDIPSNINYVPNVKQEWILPDGVEKRIALKNAFGFGGTNASLCIADYKE